LAHFLFVRAAFPHARASLAASSGIYLGPDYAFDMVRPGISLFGGGPLEVPDPRFSAVAILEADTLQIRDLKRGEAAGYGSMFTAPHDLRMAIVGAGYADGIIRAAHGGGYGVVHGVRCPFTIVTMDLIGLDVSAVPGVKIGDPVELLGPNALLDDLAKAAGSVAHECLVRLGGRAERTYRN
jgi:alanine racemase